MIAAKNRRETEAMSVEDLIPYKPGETGNPHGRPKGSKGIAATLRKYLKAKINFQNPITKKEGRMSAHDIMAIRLIVSGMSGNLKAIGQIYDRLEGRPKQAVDETVSMSDSDEPKLIKWCLPVPPELRNPAAAPQPESKPPEAQRG
ncbi:MAG: DUF5681 domain-containing protein [Sedimentisphaerales bacterium]|jgi:hypothetical protein